MLNAANRARRRFPREGKVDAKDARAEGERRRTPPRRGDGERTERVNDHAATIAPDAYIHDGTNDAARPIRLDGTRATHYVTRVADSGGRLSSHCVAVSWHPLKDRRPSPTDMSGKHAHRVVIDPSTRERVSFLGYLSVPSLVGLHQYTT